MSKPKDDFKTVLKRLLVRLEKISRKHDDLCDTIVREEMATAIYNGFLAPSRKFKLPESYEMIDEEGDEMIATALAEFLQSACPIADELGWDEKQRQDAFQDLDVTTPKGLTYDEFFGHSE